MTPRPVRQALAPLLVPLLALAAIAGCGDDDGASPFAPGRELAGMWVRYLPASPTANPTALVAFADTLYLKDDGSGRWSVMIPNMGPMAGRIMQDVYVERGGLVMRMWAMPDPCDACSSMDDFRQAPANWALIRKGEDRIELRLRRVPGLEEGASGAGLGEDVYHYARRAALSLPAN